MREAKIVVGHPHDLRTKRLDRIEKAIAAQRRYMSRVPDPDNRYRAETNLMTLLEMREALAEECAPVRELADVDA